MNRKLKSQPIAYSLRCSKCHRFYAGSSIQTYALCCDQPLLVEYENQEPISKAVLANRDSSMWRYFEMLPVSNAANIISLGEGMTPIISLKNLAAMFGFSSILIKNESFNPTGSFKARGISVAVSKAKELNITKCIIATAGNAGGALAAYCAKAKLECTVVMPVHTPNVFKTECDLYGAHLIMIEGLINDCARKVEEIKSKQNFFDVSTFKEPYRLEGKKTMGYEIAEQLNWQLPDVIIYPTGGGTGIIGIWKAFNEMHKLGWIKKPFPKMIAVQAANCAPILAAYNDPVNWKEKFVPKPSVANGMVVPFPFGLKMIQKVIDESGGNVIPVTDQEIVDGIKEVAQEEGILLSPEGSSTWKALSILRERKMVKSEDSILLLNTGSGYKYLENLKPFY